MNNDDMLTMMGAWLYSKEGENPSKAIEDQERRGQQAVVRGQRLPKKVNSHSIPNDLFFKGVADSMSYEERKIITDQNSINYTKEQYEKMGIKIIEECDDLFWTVALPEGWEIKATDHTMWNELIDNKGRKRANFFYKAAFYDRDAFINFSTRFQVGVGHIADAGEEYDIWVNSDYQGTVKDGDKVIYATACVPTTGSYTGDDKVQEELRAKLKIFMQEHYPDYEDIHAYWD